MTTEEKDKIVEAARAYMRDKGLSQNKLQTSAQISYLSNMLNGVYTYKNSRTNENADIQEKHFNKLAEFIGYHESGNIWRMVETEQSTTALYEFEQSKFKKYPRTIIGSTGSGKTFLSERFKIAHPVATYVITCNDFDTVPNLIDKILRACNITTSDKSVSRRLDKLKTEIWRDYRNGLNPVIVLDEAENLKLPTMKLFKALYDYLAEGCGLVFIGTPELIEKFDKYRLRGKDGFPQFYRRIEAGIRFLSPINPTTSFNPFFEKYNLSQDAKKLLKDRCDNYGTLKDYLLPALEESKGELITADFLKKTHSNLAI